MEKLCCILDDDEKYAVRIAACFNERRALSYPVKAFSDITAYRRCAEENEVELLLVSESMYPKMEEDTAKVVIRLCGQTAGGGEGEDTDTAGISKYQAVDNVIRDVQKIYADKEPTTAYSYSTADSARFVCVYSPNGYTGKTTLALALAHIKGQKKKVLYLNFEEFSAVMQELPERRGNLSDALFYYHTAGGGIGKILSVVSQGSGFDYIPAAVCAEDLPQFSSDVIADFLDRIAAAGGYELIIADIGSLIKEPWKLLCRADVILMPQPDSPHRRRRQMEFEKYLYTAGFDSVAERITLVEIVQDGNIAAEGKINYSRLMCGTYGKAVSAIDV